MKMKLVLSMTLVTLLFTVSVFAQEKYLNQKKYVVDSNGDKFEVWVHAPEGKVITKEIDNWMSSDKADDVLSAKNGLIQKSQKPVNLTGFKFVINRPNTSNICRTVFMFKKPIPIEIDPDGQIEIEANYAAAIFSDAFPTSGNVDMGIWSPDDGKWCGPKSKRPKNRLDSAGCYITSCSNDGWWRLTTVIWNPSKTENATFVTATHVMYND